MPKDAFHTIKNASEGIFKDKGSKFLAFAYPVNSAEEAGKYIEQLKKKYHDARHHCWAYAIGAAREEYRVNDDGEPHHSAGKPIMGQIKSFDVTNIVIIVVRYFGGTLLGVGGLINAYRSAARDALNNAQIVQEEITGLIKITCDYQGINDVMKIIKEEKLDIVQQQFKEVCRLNLKVIISEYDRIYKRFEHLKPVTIESRENEL